MQSQQDRPMRGGYGTRGRGGRGGRGRFGGPPPPPAFRKNDDGDYVLDHNVEGYTKDELKLRVLNHPRLLELSMVNPPLPSEGIEEGARRPMFRRWRLPIDADVQNINATISDGTFKARVGVADPIAIDTPIAIA